jgi:hypothetical protein
MILMYANLLFWLSYHIPVRKVCCYVKTMVSLSVTDIDI